MLGYMVEASDDSHDVVEPVDAPEGGTVNIAGEVRELTTEGWPTGYQYGATRYADVILRQSFPDRFSDLVKALKEFSPTLDELRAGGGGRTVFVARFDKSLEDMVSPEGEQVWGKQNITIEKSVSLDGKNLRTARTRGHEIDMFGKGSSDDPIPGIAVEMEWNNKDPFYDRDLINFQALHHEGAIAVGVIVTRGPRLQALIGPNIRSKDNGYKFGPSTTHWDKLIPKVNLGGGGECPLILIGIEPERIADRELLERSEELRKLAEGFRSNWRNDDSFERWADARPVYDQLKKDWEDALPPVKDSKS